MDSIQRKGRWLFSVLAFAAAALPASALVPVTGTMPDFDSAGGIRVGLPAGVAVPATEQAALSSLESRVGSPLRVTFNGLTGVPRTLSARSPLSAPSAEAPESIARAFLQANRAIWALTPGDLDGLRLDTSYSDAHNGVTHLYFDQTDGGIPIFFGVVGVHLNAKGQVLSVQGDLFPGPQPVLPAVLTPEQAASRGAQHIGVASFVPVRTGTHGDTVELARGTLLSPVQVERTIYALSGTSRLAYQMTLEKNGNEWYDLVVDASTGAVLHRRNLYQFAQLAPSAPVEPNPAGPRGLLYVEHPLATTRGTGDLLRKYPFTADPSGRTRGFANAPVNGADTFPVNPRGPNAVNATLDQTLMPLPSAGTPLRSTALPLSTSPQSPAGWFIPQGGNYLTIGNNVDSKEDHAADNENTIGLRANGGPTGDFSGASFVYQNHFGQNGPYADAAARSAGGLADVPAATLNLFYFNNWYHDLLYHLGFTEAAGNFQLDNFGRGGAGNDHVLADAQDGSGSSNANFGTPADGNNPRMQMYFWLGPERDASLDFDVVVHEYSHGLSNRLVGGPSNVNCLGTAGVTGEAGGMGEGWGDWFAVTLSDEPALSEYSGGAAVGIRTNPVGVRRNDYTYGYLCTGPLSNPNPLGCEVHGTGEFWTIVLWDLREAMINRFHNRAFPAGPTFPTFVGTGGAAGNIDVAQGRTFDGSNAAAQTDYATIENASFAAMFRVVDAMKLSVCNPTIVSMRDSILEADRNLGGEFQDLIWRAFANRGIGTLAQSANGELQTPIESFMVPATVEACESAGGPAAAPAFTAVSGAPNSVTITITPNGAAEYIVLRGTAGAGSPVDPAAFVEVGRTAGTTFEDTGLDGGTTYTYRVQAARNADCISGTNAVSVVPSGGALPCALDPVFTGLSHVVVAGDCERLLLDWAPALSSCPAAGPSVGYNVYRGTTPAFTPGAANRIATGVVGNSYADLPGAMNQIFYYIVRAEDSSTGNGGPANGGNEDDNGIALPGLVTSAALQSQGFADDVESGPDNAGSAHFTTDGLLIPAVPERGGWFRDGDPSPAAAHSPVTVWHAFNPDNLSLVYLTSDIITVTPSSILSFYHTFATEGGFDGGVIEYALVDASGTPGAFADLDDFIYESRYTGTLLSAPDNTNPLGGRRAYTGGVLGPMTRARAHLGGLVPSGMPSQRIQIRFVFASDVAQGIPPPPEPPGNFLPGWYIDDISIDEPCCPVSIPPSGLLAIAGQGQVSLTWTAPAGGGVSQYQVLRELVSGPVPATFDDIVGTVPGTQTSFVDTNVGAGLTYAYVVRAIPAGGCASADSNVVTATPFGVCVLPPTFAGLDRVRSAPQATCALTLTWLPGAANCLNASVRYNVYRGTTAGFTPSPGNAVATGLTGLSYVDASLLASGTTYYYIVRAEDSTSNGSGPANNGNEDTNLVRLSGAAQGPLAPGPGFTDDLEPAPDPGYSTVTSRLPGWQVTTDPSAHSLSNSYFVPDFDENRGTAPHRDARLTLPPVNLGTASLMTFWHNFDFARFPTGVAEEKFRSGGVLEISADGDTWYDLGPHIVQNGYNGRVFSGTVGGASPLDGRLAWVGATAGDLVSGRADPMRQVIVNLGAAIQDPSIFGATTLPSALIRFRAGTTYVILSNGLQGTGWGVDDIQLTGLLAAGVCETVQPAGLVDQLTVGRAGESDITLAWSQSCSSGDTDFEVYEGSLDRPGGVFTYSHVSRFCSTSGAATITFAPAAGSTYYLVVPRNGTSEGSYGRASDGTERPAPASACVVQTLGACP